MGRCFFHLHIGRTPCLIPPLTSETIEDTRNTFPNEITSALDAIVSLKTDVTDAHNALLASRIAQANSMMRISQRRQQMCGQIHAKI